MNQDGNHTNPSDRRDEDRLDGLLEEAASADRSMAPSADTAGFLFRLQARITQDRRRQSLAKFSIAAMILVGILTWAMQDTLDPGSSPVDTVELPDQELLLVLDVLEVLSPLSPAMISQLEVSHFDTLEGIDSDLAALPIELLIADEEERR